MEYIIISYKYLKIAQSFIIFCAMQRWKIKCNSYKFFDNSNISLKANSGFFSKALRVIGLSIERDILDLSEIKIEVHKYNI